MFKGTDGSYILRETEFNVARLGGKDLLEPRASSKKIIQEALREKCEVHQANHFFKEYKAMMKKW